MAERVRVREIDDDEGQRPLRIVRRGSGSARLPRRLRWAAWSAGTGTTARMPRLRRWWRMAREE
ncbi:hypothetical protein HC362_33605 [Streptomyces sp. 891-h]|nr:hypothetical protein HC362_33605 [Streptomyces sp. 891-h]